MAKEKPSTKTCKHCKTEIPYDAKVCPQCRKKQGKGCFSKLLIGVIILFVFMALFGGEDESGNVNFTETESEGEEKTVEFENANIYDDRNVKISISDFSEDSSDVEIQLTVENNSKKDYGIAAHSYAVNGLMAGGTEMMSDIDVPAGKKGSFSLTIDKEWLSDNGIECIGRLDVMFWAYHDDFKDWDTGVIKVKTNMYDKEKMYKPAGEEVYSDDNMTLWLVEKEDSKYKFAVKNKSSYDVEYFVENCSVNDWSYNEDNYLFDLYSESIHGKSYFEYEFEIRDDFMEENDIETVENLEFNLLMRDDYIEDFSNIWEAKSDKITIK